MWAIKKRFACWDRFNLVFMVTICLWLQQSMVKLVKDAETH